MVIKTQLWRAHLAHLRIPVARVADYFGAAEGVLETLFGVS